MQKTCWSNSHKETCADHSKSRSRTFSSEKTVRVYSDSVLCLEKMNGSEGASERWEGQVEEFKCLLLTKNCWESMEKPLNSSGIFSQDFRHCVILQEIQRDWKRKSIELEKFTGPDHLHVNVQRHRLDKERKRWNFVIRHQKSQGLRDEILARTLDVCESWRGKEVVWRILLAHLKENGIPQPIREWSDSKTQVIQYSRVSGKRRMAETPYTSTRMLRTQTFYSKSFIL